MNRFTTSTTLTHASAKAVLAAGLASIEAGARGVDCTALAEFDSSALAVLLAWRRAADARGADFEIANLPPGLASLAEVYGVDVLLSAQHRHTPEGAATPL
ncbi:MAG TPA: STAS domain-containing protein [Trinickia sp.]|jgi:phospholipid transport system transporter-binding protein|uniref:STAS domain-containing protein n=1 Tax=Trinickia sp. TaxID=2571163 RepID=UPI002C71EFAB|nr:STAS domain-containing protein [Trinickia sp.]HTI16163.1 STAS domain-containing protein [Trinickia sp.]